MKLSVLLRTSHMRGDHAADVAIAYDIKPGETVEELATRLLTKKAGFGAHMRREATEWGTDCLEIRVVRKPDTVDPEVAE